MFATTLLNMVSADCCDEHTPQKFPQSRSWRQWSVTVTNWPTQRGKTGYPAERKDWGTNACFCILLIMQPLSAPWKPFPPPEKPRKRWAASPGKGTKACRMLMENGIPLSEALSSACAWCPGFGSQPFLFLPLSCKQHHQLDMKQSQIYENGPIFQ